MAIRGASCPLPHHRPCNHHPSTPSNTVLRRPVRKGAGGLRWVRLHPPFAPPPPPPPWKWFLFFACQLRNCTPILEVADLHIIISVIHHSCPPPHLGAKSSPPPPPPFQKASYRPVLCTAPLLRQVDGVYVCLLNQTSSSGSSRALGRDL